MSSKIHPTLLCLFAFCLTVTTAIGQTSIVTNGSFEQWEKGLPTGWAVEVGATNGKDNPLSIVKQGEGPSLELSGNANTMAWRSVSQSVQLEGGKSYRFRFASKTANLKREGRQFENCYIGLLEKHERGQVLSRKILPLQSQDFLESSIVFRAHRLAAEAQILIFLSKTGTLNIKDISIEPLPANESFQILVDEMDRHYSYFDHKDIDWPALVEKYRQQVDGSNGEDFTDTVSEMLAEIKDIHIWLEYRRQRVGKFVSTFQANYDFSIVDQDLNQARSFGTLGTTALTKDGFGYIRLSSFAVDANALKEIAADIQKRLFATPGIIIDCRRNPGGSEIIAQQLGNLFTEKETTYARSKFRSGQSHNEFIEVEARKLIPASSTYGAPVVCLIGPGAVSSGEAFAMMMKSLPQVSVIGQNTRGASGNPQPVQLPNGVDIWFSRWVSMSPMVLRLRTKGLLRMKRLSMATAIQLTNAVSSFLKSQ